MRVRLGQCIAGAALACITASAWGLDLLTAYRQALANDATFQASRSTLEATRENIPQARAGLLPQISASGQKTRNFIDQRQFIPTGGSVDREFYYFAESASLALRQPIYRRLNWAQLSQAEAQVAAAEATFEKDRQDAALRVAAAYFDILAAQSRVRVIQVQLEAYTGQWKLAERAFSAGAGTRTDIDDARARALQATAALTEAEFTLMNARRSLAVLIGKPPDLVADVVPARLVLAPPDPPALDRWLQEAEAGNPELASLRHQVEVARQEVERQRSGHFPTVDLIAGRQYGSNESTTTINTRSTTDYVGLQLALPIFSGGAVSSAVRQAAANVTRAQFVLDAARDRISVDAQRSYHGVTQTVEKVRALENARDAASQAVISSRRGVEAGTRTIVDVLNAVQREAEVTQDLAQARVDFLAYRLRLAAAAGQLDDDAFARVNTALGTP